MGFNIDKDKTFTISWSAITSIAGSLVAVWAFGGPIIESALAQEIKDQVEPLSDAFEVVMAQNIRNLRNSIAAMEFKREMCVGTPNCWTVRDAQDLTNAEAELRTAESALTKLRESKK